MNHFYLHHALAARFSGGLHQAVFRSRTTAALTRYFVLVVALAWFVFASIAQAQSQSLPIVVPAPRGMAFDPSGSLFVAGQSLGLRKITPANVITTVPLVGFTSPYSAAVSAAGDVFVGSFATASILQISPAGVETPFATGLASGAMAFAFASDGSLFALLENGTLLRFPVGGGAPVTFATIPRANGNRGMAIDSAGTLYVTNEVSGELHTVSPAGAVTLFVTGLGGANGIALEADGSAIVAQFSGRRVVRISPSGVVTTIASGFDATGVIVTAAGKILVGNNAQGRIEQILAISTSSFAVTGTATPTFNEPMTITASISGKSPTGTFTVTALGRSCIATITGGTGSCTLTAPAGGDIEFTGVYSGDEFNAGSVVKQRINIARAPQAINFDAIGDKNITTAFVNVNGSAQSVAVSGLEVLFTSDTPSICDFDPFQIGSRLGEIIYSKKLNFFNTGICTVRAVQPGSGDWLAATPVVQSFTISPPPAGAQTINFPQPANVQLPASGSVNIALAISASSGLPSAVGSATPGICTVAPGAAEGSFVATATAAGTCTIRATQAGGTIGSGPTQTVFAAATPVERSIVIAPVPQAQVITFTPANQTLASGETKTVSVTATSSSNLPVSFASQTTSVCTVSGNTVTLLSVGTCTLRATQAGNASFLAAAALDRSFTITAATVSACSGSVASSDCDNDGVPNAVEIQEGLNPEVKDNDVFANTAKGKRLFVMQLYRDVLDREGDTAGITFWTGRLDSGAANSLNRAQMVEVFLFSPEATGGRTLSPEEAVTKLYNVMLDRGPDAAGLAFWAAEFRRTGSLVALCAAFVASAEYRARFL